MQLVFTFWVLLATTVLGIRSSENNGYSRNSNHRSLQLPIELRKSFPETPPEDDLLALSSGEGKQKKKEKGGGSGESDEKKTLAQQVADGKYALIQNELFLKPPKRPGIISYEANSEIPNDTVHNLGGLTKKEIWLAESHLLVLTGGTFHPYETDGSRNTWRPIDNFKAPRRPVKLPTHPKVPPPFPVQLIEGGPLQILGTNSTRAFDESEEASTPVPPPEGYIPGSGPFFPASHPDPTDPSSGKTPITNSAYAPEAVPTPVFALNNSNLPPHFASLPPGAVVLPPPKASDMTDDDDPSIYYPPPYTFYYEMNNSTFKVPPGPLVPGLILPPPPNFFAPLEEPTSTESVKSTKISTSTKTTVRFRMKSPRKNTTSTTEHSNMEDVTTSTVPPSYKYKTKHSRVSFVEKTTAPNHYNRPIFRARNRTAPVVQQRPFVLQRQKISSEEKQETEKPNITSSQLVEEIHIKKIKDNATPISHNLEEVHIKNTNDETTPNSFFTYSKNSSPKPNMYEPPTITTTRRIPVRIYITPKYPEDNSQQENPSLQRQNVRTKKPKQLYYFTEKPKNQYLPPLSPPSQNTNSEENINNPQNEAYFIPNRSTERTKEKSARLYVTRNYYTSPSPIKFIPSSGDDNFKNHVSRIRQQIQNFYDEREPLSNHIKAKQQQSQPLYQYSFEANNYQQHRTVKLPDHIEQQHQYLPQNQPVRYINDGQRFTVEIQPAIEVTTERPLSTAKPIHRQQNPYLITPQDAYYSTPKPKVEIYYADQQQPYFEKSTPGIYKVFGKTLEISSTAAPEHHQRTGQRPISLEGDILINYLQQRPPINPDAEFIQIPSQRGNYVQNKPEYFEQTGFPQRRPEYSQQDIDYTQQRPNYPERRPAYSGQRPQNYYQNGGLTPPPEEPQIQKQPHLQQDDIYLNRELYKSNQRQAPSDRFPNESPTAFISYKLPGDEGAHFYFLTPQQAKEQHQGVTYYFEKNNNEGIK